MPVNNFTTIESLYGTFIVNRHCAFQAEALIKTGQPHIQEELSKVLAVVNSLPNDCVVLDAGANIGLLAIPIAQVVAAKHGRVYAYEAQRMMSYALAGATALNDIANLFVVNQALGEKEEILRAPAPDYGKPQDFGLFSLVEQKEDYPETIQATTIDALQLPRLDFLKVDIEGMEIQLLKGGKNTIHAHSPWCWIEYWKVDINEIKEQFEGLDYQFYIMDQLNMLCAPAARLAGSGINIDAPLA